MSRLWVRSKYTVRSGPVMCTTDRHCPTKTLSAPGDMESDQLHVPAILFHCEWHAAKPRTAPSHFGLGHIHVAILYLNLLLFI